MSFASLVNILISSIDSNNDKNGTEEDVRRMFGWYQKRYITYGLVEEKRMIE